jgi:uncharacterized protein YndB with AHSA1/START domain
VERVERSSVLSASRREVWAAFADPEMLSEWFGGDVIELDLRPGGRIALRTHDGTIRRALVVAAEPPTLLEFRWLPVEELPDGTVSPIARTTVELTLEEAGEGTRVTVTETGPRSLARA